MKIYSLDNLGFNIETGIKVITWCGTAAAILSLFAGADGRVCGNNTKPYRVVDTPSHVMAWVGCFGRGVSSQVGSPLEEPRSGRNVIRNP